MLLLLIGMSLGAAIGILVAALCVATKKEDNPCRNCVVYHDPESDYRHCFDCERGKGV